ncbi:hypothetical protein CRG98_015091 [Punica granatum]|uniref:Uncharacterized protein n=1 Tax=Punica granatum TaxID=22663 RepID=A0A2I0K7K6_PUNGR|nr:hypothetical protein CRG98_015091 [Punica granatum]
MGLQKIPLSAKVTNEMFGHIFGASCLSRDTRSPMDAFSDRAPGVRSTDKQTAPQNGPTGTQGPSKSMNKLQMTFRNPTRPPEECLSVLAFEAPSSPNQLCPEPGSLDGFTAFRASSTPLLPTTMLKLVVCTPRAGHEYQEQSLRNWRNSSQLGATPGAPLAAVSTQTAQPGLSL